jgi:hypothetical protein
LTDSLFNPIFSLEQTAVLGAFVIYQAKKYCSQYCGGKTDVWAMTEIGEIVGLQEDEIAKLEVLFAKNSCDLLDVIAEGSKLLGRKF